MAKIILNSAVTENCVVYAQEFGAWSCVCALFFILSWNLMCIAGNAVCICFRHLIWHEDALAIRFGHMKNDQESVMINISILTQRRLKCVLFVFGDIFVGLWVWRWLNPFSRQQPVRQICQNIKANYAESRNAVSTKWITFIAK